MPTVSPCVICNGTFPRPVSHRCAYPLRGAVGEQSPPDPDQRRRSRGGGHRVPLPADPPEQPAPVAVHPRLHRRPQHASSEGALCPARSKALFISRPDEKRWMSQVQEITGEAVPFWITVAGWQSGLHDQMVGHGALAAGGRSFSRAHSLRPGGRGEALASPFERRARSARPDAVAAACAGWSHHSQGVLCPVTLLMAPAASNGGGKAAADQLRLRGGVAGGRGARATGRPIRTTSTFT